MPSAQFFAGSRFFLALRYARRELRSGLQGFRVFVACLTLGVTIIAGVGSLAAALLGGLTSDARSILGGDIELRLVYRQATQEQLEHFQASGRVSRLVSMRAMAQHPVGKTTPRLVELRAVDSAYPLYGEMRLSGAMPLSAALSQQNGVWGAVVEKNLLGLMQLKIGDRVRLGQKEYEIRAHILHEPDRGGNAFGFGPRVILGLDSLNDSGLMASGALLYHHYRIAFPPDTKIQDWKDALKQRFPKGGWRIRDFRNASPGVRQFVQRITLFLQLVGLTALLVGGVGVSNAVNAYLTVKMRTIAMLKSVGASSPFIGQVYLLQIIILTGISVTIGLAIGAILPPLAWRFFGDSIPLPPAQFGLYFEPLLIAAGFGFLTALCFSLIPLAQISKISAAGLFRTIVNPQQRWPGKRMLIALISISALLIGLVFFATSDAKLAGGFVGGAVLCFFIFRVSAALIIWLAGRIARWPWLVQNRPGLRLALANLHRPGSATVEIVMSLGLGLTVLVVIGLIQSNLSRQVTKAIPQQAPDFFFLDIQPQQVAEFETLVAAIPGADLDDRMPMLRARVTKFKDRPAAELIRDPNVAWVLRGDRGLTYATTPPRNSRIIAGEWWQKDYTGPPLVSVSADVAKGFGVGIGDSMTINLLGRTFDLTIANIRRVEWASLGMNFTFVISPGLLEKAPHTHIATIRTSGPAYERILNEVTKQFPNISAVPVREALRVVNGILIHIGTATTVIASLTLLAGTLVLAGAIAAGHRRRVYDSIVFKVLGATRRMIMTTFLIEYGLLGCAAGFLAVLLGAAGAGIFAVNFFQLDWQFEPEAMLFPVLVCLIVTLAGGFIGTWRALGVPAAPLLRND